MLNIFKTKKRWHTQTLGQCNYLKLCRNPAYKGYEDFQDGQTENKKTRRDAEAPELEKVICCCWYKIISGT